MTQEQKELLLKDLCARLPYDVIIHYHWEIKGSDSTIDDDRKLKFSDVESLKYMLTELQDNRFIIEWKPYLRPMSSMTKKEKKDFLHLTNWDENDLNDIIKYPHMYEFTIPIKAFDWLNKNHFDYRDLIPKGLAIEVTKDSNPYK